jgi:ActR/RegA family two-component response regulator
MVDATPSVLIVEDNWILAMEEEYWLTQAGMRVVGPAGTLDSAQALARESQPDFAVVDFNLRGEMAGPLIDQLREQGVKTVVLTGYADVRIGGGVIAVLRKPCLKQDLFDALGISEAAG